MTNQAHTTDQEKVRNIQSVTINKWLDANPDKWNEAEQGHGYATESGFAYDILLARGWCEEGNPEHHTIIERTVKNTMAKLRTIEPCKCHDCITGSGWNDDDPHNTNPEDIERTNTMKHDPQKTEDIIIHMTENETNVLFHLCENNFRDGRDISEAWIWSDSIQDSKHNVEIPEKSLGGIVASLIKKGMVESDGNEGRDACLRVRSFGEHVYRCLTNHDGSYGAGPEPEPKKHFRAVTAKGVALVSVLATGFTEAQKAAQVELEKPGREHALKMWKWGGHRMVPVLNDPEPDPEPKPTPDPEPEIKRYAAINLSGAPIVSVLATDEDAARQNAEAELSKPGRSEALKIWKGAGRLMRVALDPERPKFQYKGITKSGTPLVAVLATDIDAASEKVEAELSKPGRLDALKMWVDSGRRVVQVDHRPAPDPDPEPDPPKPKVEVIESDLPTKREMARVIVSALYNQPFRIVPGDSAERKWTALARQTKGQLADQYINACAHYGLATGHGLIKDATDMAKHLDRTFPGGIHVRADAKGCVWISAEDADEIGGFPTADYYESAVMDPKEKRHRFGIHRRLIDELAAHGWGCDWNDPGTVVAHCEGAIGDLTIDHPDDDPEPTKSEPVPESEPTDDEIRNAVDTMFPDEKTALLALAARESLSWSLERSKNAMDALLASKLITYNIGESAPEFGNCITPLGARFVKMIHPAITKPKPDAVEFFSIGNRIPYIIGFTQQSKANPHSFTRAVDVVFYAPNDSAGAYEHWMKKDRHKGHGAVHFVHSVEFTVSAEAAMLKSDDNVDFSNAELLNQAIEDLAAIRLGTADIPRWSSVKASHDQVLGNILDLLNFG